LKPHYQERNWNKNDCKPDIGELKLYYGGKWNGILERKGILNPH